ncbi:MAG: DUF6129 family protein [Pseudomonadota bacterium]
MISEQTLIDIADRVGAQTLDETITRRLRADFPGVHFTYCMDDDVTSAKPVLARKGFNLYLIDSRDHCLAFTRQCELATGVVVAEVIEDE